MTSERERMLAGELYRAFDPELLAARARAREVITRYNDAPNISVLEGLFERLGANAVIEPPFHCDYGSNISIGDRAVIGAGSVVTKDVAAGVVAAGNPCRPIRELEAVR